MFHLHSFFSVFFFFIFTCHRRKIYVVCWCWCAYYVVFFYCWPWWEWKVCKWSDDKKFQEGKHVLALLSNYKYVCGTVNAWLGVAHRFLQSLKCVIVSQTWQVQMGKHKKSTSFTHASAEYMQQCVEFGSINISQLSISMHVLMAAPLSCTTDFCCSRYICHYMEKKIPLFFYVRMFVEYMYMYFFCAQL